MFSRTWMRIVGSPIAPKCANYRFAIPSFAIEAQRLSHSTFDEGKSLGVHASDEIDFTKFEKTDELSKQLASNVQVGIVGAKSIDPSGASTGHSYRTVRTLPSLDFSREPVAACLRTILIRERVPSGVRCVENKIFAPFARNLAARIQMLAERGSNSAIKNAIKISNIPIKRGNRIYHLSAENLANYVVRCNGKRVTVKYRGRDGGETEPITSSRNERRLPWQRDTEISLVTGYRDRDSITTEGN